MAKAVIKNGKKKWRPKNRVNVGLLTEGPPQTHATISDPTYGITLNKLVITEVPQKDICPQGSTYPKNAVPMAIKNISTPILHVSVYL